MNDFAAIARSVSASAPPSGQCVFQGSVSFGAALSVERFRLANGLTILLMCDRSAPVIAFQAWFKVGSRHERPGKTGLAHLFEHLMFNEVEGLGPGEFDTRMEAIGADNNASTWLDFTQYQEAFPKQHLPLVLELESRRMHQLILRDPQVASEKEVVKNERRYRVEDDVEGKTDELLWQTAFTAHPYHWPTIGWMDDIEGFSTADCRDFYEKYYAPNNATVVLAGDLDHQDAISRIAEHYGRQAPSEIPEDDVTVEPPQQEQRDVELLQPTPTEKLTVGYKGPALAHEDHAPLTLLLEVLAGGRASRLHQRLVVGKEIASDVSGFVGPHVFPSLAEFSLAARAGHTCEEIGKSFDDEVERVQESRITEEELRRGQNRMELGLLGSLETAEGKASSIGFYETIVGDPAAAFHRLKQMQNCTPDTIIRVARRYLRKESRTIIRVRPSNASRSST